MDVRLSSEQRALRDTAAQLVGALGPRSVSDLDDAGRAARLAAAVDSVGWRELRAGSRDGQPLGSAVDTALVEEELARGLADTPFLGATLAAELRRLAGAPPATGPETVLLAPDLAGLAAAIDGNVATRSVAIDARGATRALLLANSAAASGHGNDGPGDLAAGKLASVAVPQPVPHVDLTRPVSVVDDAAAQPIGGQQRTLSAADLTRWSALALALTCADLVGIMFGAIDVTREYAKIRRQFGAPIGAFQAIQHLLADALVAAEGSRSVALHAAWAADALPPEAARIAAAVAKAYCSRAARTVCETAIQVHGGIGNTWECIAHVYLRRALMSSQILGGEGTSLAHVLAGYGIGSGHGLQ